MPRPAVTAAIAATVLSLATGCVLPGDGETVPASEDQRTAEPEDRAEETAVPGADEPVSGPEPAPGAEPAEEVPEEAAEYMAALAAGDDPERMRGGLELALEDSTAHAYLRHFTQVASAWESAGDPRGSSALTPSGEGFELCHEEAQGPVCLDFTRFTMRDGQLTGFLVNGQDPGKRLVSAHGVAASSEGVDVHLLTAYRSVTDDTLVVTADFTTVDNVDLDLFGAAYTAPDGTEYQAEEAVGEYDLDAGATTQTALYFTGPGTGGDLAVTGCLDECFAVVDLSFPVA
jgi:hypothetical protein